MYRIKEVRNKVGLTSSMVSNYLGIDLKMYLMIENEEMHLNSKMIEQLCLLFGCEEKVLFQKDIEIDCICLKNVNYQELCDIVHFRKIYAQIR